jgi:predicted transposase YbfD/YdcC
MLFINFSLMELMMSKNKPTLVDPVFLMDYLQALDDPRIDRTKKHALIDILVIAICAAICGAKTWIDIQDCGKSKQEWFSTFLNLKHGIPSHDTFRRLFLILRPEKFHEIFMNWVSALTQDTDLKQICIDGKTLRGSHERSKGASAIHMINAWSTGASLSLGQLKSEGKSNEIKTIPKLLDLLDIEGALVSTDAMGCQKEIAEKILTKKGDYLFALKGNPYLEDRVKEKFDSISNRGPKPFIVEEYTDENTGHGRNEKREYRVITAKNDKPLGINPLEKWPSLNSLIEVKSQRITMSTGEISEEVRYYISSSTQSAKDFSSSIRGHWEVENKLHWVLDVVFREDDCRSRAGYSAENFSMLRQFALNLIKQGPSKKAIRRKQNIAGWDEKFLLKILIGAGDLDA